MATLRQYLVALLALFLTSGLCSGVALLGNRVANASDARRRETQQAVEEMLVSYMAFGWSILVQAILHSTTPMRSRTVTATVIPLAWLAGYAMGKSKFGFRRRSQQPLN